ncbi:MAG: antitoxin [Caulobacter sp.]|nr:antitoxin [Caulobacter sp.]
MSKPPPGFSEAPPEPFSIFDEIDEAAEAAADAEAEADIAAGRLIPHEEVAAWLDTWGTPDFKPAPKSWFK